jgi:hypothetical protein
VDAGEATVLYKGGVMTHHDDHRDWHNGFVGFVVRRLRPRPSQRRVDSSAV